MGKRKKFLVADLLCGAGGSSTGCERALAELGLEMELVCVNHWGVAIETHRKNHPQARHYCEDIAAVRPHRVVPEGRLDLLMASPSCTHHSVARGGKPTSDQQRSDPWHIVTWLTELDVERIIIENVWEFTGWGPVDPKTMRPIKARKGEYFAQWIATLQGLGYTLEWRRLNAADYGDATTRQRFILMGRKNRPGKKPVPLAWPMPTHQKRADGGLALFPGIKPWRPAREIIDWGIRGKSIFDRKKPLAPKTLARIHAGIVKFGWPEPFLVILRNHMAAQGLDLPVPTIAANGQHIGLAQPLILSPHNSGAPRAASDPLPTITTGGAASEERQGCARPMLVEPFVATVAHGNDAKERDPNSRRANSVDDPLGTVHGDGVAYAVVEPFVMSRHAEGAPRSASEPIPTQTTVHSPVLVTAYYGANEGCKAVDDPLDTITTKERFGIVEPVAAPHYDILFRMLEPHELAAAMGFTGEDYAYEFAGTKTQQVKQIGNAVSVAKMKACVGALCADAAPKRKAARATTRRAAA